MKELWHSILDVKSHTHIVSVFTLHEVVFGQYLCHKFTKSCSIWQTRAFKCSKGLCKISCILEASEARYRPALKPQKQLNQMRKQVSHSSTATPAHMSSWINTKKYITYSNEHPLQNKLHHFVPTDNAVLNVQKFVVKVPVLWCY